MKKLFPLFALFLAGCWITRSQTISTNYAPLQVKACQRVGSTTKVFPCQFDHSVVPGDLIVIATVGGCDQLVPANDCQGVFDSQGNKFSTAFVVPYYNGQPLWYALNAIGGPDTIDVTSGTNGWLAVIAEYPPATGFEEANYGTYQGQNYKDCVQGQSCAVGWAIPIEPNESCELLISWDNLGSFDWENFQNSLHSPIAGPEFTVRAYEYGGFALEDRTTTTPGLYIGTMGWNAAAHWTEGVAAFKMGGCHGL